MPATLGSFFSRRLRQRLFSTPHYLKEIALIRGKDDLYRWSYFKFPNSFSLSEFPTRITIELTNACNFKCPHCWREVMTRKVGFMDVAIFRKIVEELKPHKAHCDLKILGLGESCLHPHFQEFMESLRDNGISCMLYTNGTLFRRFTPEQILEWKIQRLVVSVDGLDADSFARLRFGGNYQNLRRDLQQFRDVRHKLKIPLPEIEIRHVIMPDETFQQLRHFKNDWETMSDGVKFNYVMPLHAREEIDAISRPKCRDVRREFYIEWDARTPLCGYAYSKEHTGNLNASTIQELWMGPERQQLRGCHQSGNLDAVPLCKSCSHT